MPLLTPFGTKISAVAIGTILDYYDFSVFGSMVDVIGDLFFPHTSKIYSLLASLSVFGSAFLMRPLGGLFIGMIGDTLGRQRALEISILLMLFPSFLIGLLPPYEVAGIASTIALVVLRLVQGLAVGGEMVGAFVFTVESAGGSSPGFWGSLMKSTSLVGNALGLGVATTLRHFLSEEAFRSWGWRVPFFLSLGLALIGLYLRKQIVLDEEEIANNSDRKEGDEEKETFSCGHLATQWRELLLISAVVALWAVGYYTCFVWLVYFTSTLMYGGELIVENAWWINLGMTLVLIVLFPVGGLLGDWATTTWYPPTSSRMTTNGFRLIMMAGAAGLVICSLPSFYLISQRNFWSVCAGYLMFALALALYGGNMPAYLVYKFPPESRYTGVGLGYNIANAIFASSAAVVQTTLSMSDHVSDSGGLFPSLYLSGVAFFSFIVLMAFDPMVETHQLKRFPLSGKHNSSSSSSSNKKKGDIETMETMDTSENGGGSTNDIDMSVDMSVRSTTALFARAGQ
jgi:MHS family proline/betaine transporter-like MFS transporter